MAENVVADYLTGKAVRLKVVRLADLFVLDWADGLFKSAGWTTPLKTVPEDANTVGLYLTTADVSTWNDGDYVFVLTDTLITTRPIAERTVRVAAGLVVEPADVERWRALAPSVLISGRVDADAQVVGSGAVVAGSFAADAVSASAFSQGAADKAWSSAARTLTSFGALVSDVATAVWGAAARTLTSFGTLATDVWAAATRTLTASLDPTAAQVRAEIDANSTQLAAIKAKTDNLPGDPADQSLIIAATDAIMGRLGAPVGTSVSADIAALGIEPSVAFPNFQFEMYDLTGNLLPGLTVTASRVIGAGAYAPCANSPVEVGSGTYRIDLAASDLAGRPVTFMAEAEGARPAKLELITSKR